MPRVPKSTGKLAPVDYTALGVPKGTRKKREPIGQQGTLKVYKRLAPRNEERHAHQHAQQFGEQAEACRAMPCAACGWTSGPGQRCDPHHEPPVSLGGLDADTVPLCRPCHDARHATTDAAFWSAVGLDPEDAKDAVRVWMRSPAYLASRGGL